jgi:Uma2 family endonuclease
MTVAISAGARPVEHPQLSLGEYRALQAAAGWSLPIEFINGDAVVTPPLAVEASDTQGELFVALRIWQKETSAGGLLAQDVLVALPDGTHSAPDISFWTAPRHPENRHGAVDVVPDLAVEVMSPRTRANDLGAKRDAYMRAGVRELWLVDPPAQTVRRVFPNAGEVLLTGNDHLQSTLLPGFSLDISTAFDAQV